MDSNILLPLLLLSLLSLLAPSLAEIKTLKITDDARPMILFEKFGFTPRGHVNIAVTGVTSASTLSTPDPSLMGFFLLSEENLISAIYDSQNQNPSTEKNPNSNFCVLNAPYVTLLFTFRDLSPPPFNSFNHSYPITAPDEYSLFFANCAPESHVTMSVFTEMYNLQADGRPDYLSVGQSTLPSLYASFSVAYVAFLGSWIYFCLFSNRSNSHKIHLLMGGLLLTKALYLIFAAEDQHYIKVTGTPHGWDVLFYLFQFLKGVLLFTVIILIGTGWSFLKPFLQEREKRVLMIVIPLQVLANVASVVTGETGPSTKYWVTWYHLFLFIDIICCCAIIFPIVWSIRSLREASKTDGKAARNLTKLMLFRKFYIVVVGYLYFTRIVVFALKTIAAYKYRWVSILADEAASLAFYAFMFYMFRPAEKNEYFAVDDDEEGAAQMVLREEEFEL